MWVHVGGVSLGEWQSRLASCPESDLLGKCSSLLCLRSGAWATPPCLRPTGPWLVNKPSWRLPPKCQVPTAYKWLPSLVLGPGSPAAPSASC